MDRSKEGFPITKEETIKQLYMKIGSRGAPREAENGGEASKTKLPKRRVSRGRKRRKRTRSQLLMENDRGWEAECAGGAWAGHSGGTGF